MDALKEWHWNDGLSPANSNPQPDPVSLPEGVGRVTECPDWVGLENCDALRISLCGDHHPAVIVWRPPFREVVRLVPAEPGKRTRDLRPGDPVLYDGGRRTVVGVEIFR